MMMTRSDIRPARWPVVGAALAFALACAMTLAAPAPAKILVPDGSQQSREGVTVVLADGWAFADVQVHWFANEGLLAVERADGARRTFRPEDLAGLRDAGGRDITRDVLPAWAVDRLGGDLSPDAPPTPAVPDPPPVAESPPAPAPVPEWRELGDRDADPRAPAVAPGDPRVIFGLEFGYGEPHDQHYGGYDGGFGFEASLRMQLAGPFYLAGGYLHQTLRRPGFMPLPEPCLPDDGCAVLPVAGDNARITGTWLGLSLVSTAEGPRPVRFYMQAGVGSFDVEEMPIWAPEDSYLGYRFGTGFLFPMGENAALDLGVRGLHLQNLDIGTGLEEDHTMLSLHAGIDLLGF